LSGISKIFCGKLLLQFICEISIVVDDDDDDHDGGCSDDHDDHDDDGYDDVYFT
jgi:hypothetical protein